MDSSRLFKANVSKGQLNRRGFVQSGALVLLLGAQELAWGANIMAVRVWPAKEYTRVTIESDVPLGAQPFLVANPARLALDITGVDLNPALKELVGKIKSDDPFIAGVRVGQRFAAPIPSECGGSWQRTLLHPPTFPIRPSHDHGARRDARRALAARW